jgi:hypothetical protein
MLWLLALAMCTNTGGLQFIYEHNSLMSVGNPLKGFCGSPSWCWGGECSERLASSLEFAYIPLKDVMQGFGTFTFDTGLEPHLVAAADRNRHLIVRLYLDYPTHDVAVPDFLVDGLTFNKYTDYGGGQSPDYTNSTLIDAMTAAVTEFGRLYDTDQRLGFVQVGLLGFWGEWHTYPHGEWGASIAVEDQLLETFASAFPSTQVQVRRPTARSVALGLGYHDDSFAYSTTGSTAPDWFFWPTIEAQGAQEFWRTAAMGGELRPELQASIFGSDYVIGLYTQDFDAVVGTTHATYLLNYHGFKDGGESYSTDTNSTGSSELERAAVASRSLGYDLFVSQMSITASEGAGSGASAGEMTLTAHVTNVGVAPFYYDLSLLFDCHGNYSSATNSSGGTPMQDTSATDSVPLSRLAPGSTSVLAIDANLCWCGRAASVRLHSAKAYVERPVKLSNAEADPTTGAVSIPTIPYTSCARSGSGGGGDGGGDGRGRGSGSDWSGGNEPPFVWNVDRSGTVDTTPEGNIIRGDRGLPVTRYSNGRNGGAVNIYGGRGRMPHYLGERAINGGLPQLGDLAYHLEYYKTDLNALIRDPDYQGYCLLDYEYWRADWNSTGGLYRQHSIEAASGNETLAALEYEAGAKRFMLATIEATRELRPGCRIGWYGYPRNKLPFNPTVAYTNWCSWPQNAGACWFRGYSDADHPAAAAAARLANDQLQWLFDALDVITPSVYLGLRDFETTAEANRQYIRSTIEETVRLLQKGGYHTHEDHLAAPEGSSAGSPSAEPASAELSLLASPPWVPRLARRTVMPYTWYMYNNYHTVPSSEGAPREFLTAADAAIEFLEPLAAGADGVFVWGAVEENTGDWTNTSHTVAPLQHFVNTVLEHLLTPAPTAAPTNTGDSHTPTPSPTGSPTTSPTVLLCDTSLWIDVDGHHCEECTVLALLTRYGSCRNYCAAQQGGLDCVGSWTDKTDGCVKSSGNNGCDSEPNSSDDICECSVPATPSPTTGPTNNPSTSFPTATILEPTGSDAESSTATNCDTLHCEPLREGCLQAILGSSSAATRAAAICSGGECLALYSCLDEVAASCAVSGAGGDWISLMQLRQFCEQIESQPSCVDQIRSSPSREGK